MEERAPLTRSLNKHMKDVKSTEWPVKVRDERNCRLNVCTKQTVPAQRALQDLGGEARDSDDKGRNSESQSKG